MKRNGILYFYLSLFLICIVIAAAALLYRAGWRLSGATLVHVGSIDIAVHESGSSVFIDSELKTVTTAAEEKDLFKNIDPDMHTVIVSKDGFWPWKKDIEVGQNETEEISSFELPQSPAVTEVAKASDEYTRGIVIALDNVLPTIDHKKISADGTVGIWVEGSTLYAEWLSKAAVPDFFCSGNCSQGGIVANVLEVSQPIKNVAFFKSRNDVILFSNSTGINAIEIDKRGTQNFQPLFTGAAPEFDAADDNTIYARSSNSLFKIAY